MKMLSFLDLINLLVHSIFSFLQPLGISHVVVELIELILSHTAEKSVEVIAVCLIDSAQ